MMAAAESINLNALLIRSLNAKKVKYIFQCICFLLSPPIQNFPGVKVSPEIAVTILDGMGVRHSP